jgi:hypothetical protein
MYSVDKIERKKIIFTIIFCIDKILVYGILSSTIVKVLSLSKEGGGWIRPLN